MRTRNLMIIVLSMILGNLSGQADFRPGYVILANKDTVMGEIDSRGDLMMSQLCRFKQTTAGPVISYSPHDIIEYRFLDGKCYVSRILENGNRVFLEYLIKGMLNIYYYRDVEGEDHYLISKENFPLIVIPYKEEFRTTDDGIKIFYESTFHIGLLQIYTNDAPDFLQEPLKIKKPDHNNLIDFAKKYHNRVCKDEVCIIYEKDVPLIKASVDLTLGLKSQNKDYFSKPFASEFGAYIYLWMPRANERLYFKTGFLLSPNEIDNKKGIYGMVPVHVQYQYSHFKLAPKAFLGISTYFAGGHITTWTIAAGAGVDFRLSNNVSLTSNMTAEFIPPSFMMINKEFLSNSVNSPFLSYTVSMGIRFDIWNIY